MTVTLIVLVIFAALLIPAIANQRKAQIARSFANQVTDIVSFAKQKAINQGVITTLAYDSTNNQFTVTTDTDMDPNQPGLTDQGTGQDSMTGSELLTNPNSTQNASQPTLPTVNMTTAIPDGWQGQQFQLGTQTLNNNSQSVDSEDWKINFYPDGASDGGSIEFQSGANADTTLSIDEHGLLTITDGPPPDPTTIKWQGGNIARRQSS